MGVYSLNEGFLDKISMDQIKQWKLANEKQRIKKYSSSNLTLDEGEEIIELIRIMRDDSVGYGDYKRAFTKFCRKVHTIPTGTIIRSIDIKKNSDGKSNNFYCEYADNTKKITLPEGTKLYHISTVDNIKKLIPFFRGKAAKGYLYDKPRIYFTIRKEMPKFLADIKPGAKTHTYLCKEDIREVYVDPLVPSNIQGAVYIETNKEIKVEEVGIAKKEETNEGFEFDTFFDMITESGLILCEQDEVEDDFYDKKEEAFRNAHPNRF